MLRSAKRRAKSAEKNSPLMMALAITLRNFIGLRITMNAGRGQSPGQKALRFYDRVD
jgi:hypothetical protein